MPLRVEKERRASSLLAPWRWRPTAPLENSLHASAERRSAALQAFPSRSRAICSPARGDAYAQRYIPEAFVCLSESIDLHQVKPERIQVPSTLIGVLEDQLVPIADLRSLATRLDAPCELVEISSPYGHDAFLKEVEALRPVLARALQRPATDPGAPA